MKTLVYIGTYTTENKPGIGIYTPDQTGAALVPAGDPAPCNNPSYLALSHDQKTLYAVLETAEYKGQNGGAAAAFRVGADGSLTPFGEESTHGRHPCHLVTNKTDTALAAANYTEGTVTLFPLDKDGRILKSSSIAAFVGSGPVVGRQEEPHAHCAVYTPDERFLCTVDLGDDAVKLFTVADNTLTLREDKTVRLRPGTGPRHLVFAPGGRFAYLCTELSSEIVVLKYDEDYNFNIVQYVSTVPADYAGNNYPAAIRIAPDSRFVYVSNRGEDSIAVFAIEAKSGRLTPAGRFSTGGKNPRDFNISPDGTLLLVANQDSDAVTSFRLDPQTGAAQPAGVAARLHCPVSILFYEIKG